MTEPEALAEVQRLRKRIDRERRARHEAELIAEQGLRQLYARQRELELLNSITDAANGAVSVEAAIQFTLNKVCAYTGWPAGHAYLVGEDPNTLLSTTIWHLENAEKIAEFRKITENTSFRKGEGLPGRVLESGRSIWIVDVSADANFPRNKNSSSLAVQGAFAFPVVAGSTVVAALEFFSTKRLQPEETWMEICEQAGKQLGRIFERKRASDELEKVHTKLLGLSRAAGMAEVATGVLHNVGNVLNSVSVLATLVRDRLRESEVGNVHRASSMLYENKEQLAQFVAPGSKGERIPEYLAKASRQLAAEREEVMKEMAMVGEHIEHIKEIVAMQQTYAKVSGLIEPVSAESLVQDALRMNTAAFERHGVRVSRRFEENVPNTMVDRHKALQILINLLRNAKYAMDERGGPEKVLEILVGKTGEGKVAITVKDNGVGIAPENLNRIFGHGFTTKKDGHGFGLHSGALAARDMKGTLTVQSEGLGKGATFTLELPAAKPLELEATN